MKLISLLGFLLVVSAVHAQPTSEQFAQAVDAYGKNSYSECIRLLSGCENSLGRTNPKIESLRALAYGAAKDWVNASVALSVYFRIVPPAGQNSPAHKDLLALKEKVDQEIRNGDKVFVKERDSKRMKAADEMIVKTEKPESVKIEKLQKASAQSMYNTYKKSTEPEVLQEYITMFPNTGEAMELKFKKLVLEGDAAVQRRNWEKGISKYSEALDIRKDDDVHLKRAIAWDEKDFETAKQDNTVGSYEKYRSEYPDDGLHLVEADAFLQEAYLSRARENSGRDFDAAEYNYKKYQSTFPRGPKIRTVDAELCSLYLREAKRSEKGKTYGDVSRAIEMYEHAAACGKKVSSGTVNALKRKQTRWVRNDYVFTGWHADQTNLVGLMFGSLNNRKCGFYVSGRGGEGAFDKVAYWQTDNQNSVQGSVDLRKTFTGVIKSKTIYGTLGLTKKIVHPLWFYLGAGVCISNEIREFKHNITGELEFAENKDLKYTAPDGEAGLFLKLGPLVFQYGVNRPFSPKFRDQFVQHFGVAFNL